MVDVAFTGVHHEQGAGLDWAKEGERGMMETEDRKVGKAWCGACKYQIGRNRVFLDEHNCVWARLWKA